MAVFQTRGSVQNISSLQGFYDLSLCVHMFPKLKIQWGQKVFVFSVDMFP